jgi:hypothetical protein
MTGPTHFRRPGAAVEDAHLIDEAVIGAMTRSGIDGTCGRPAGLS